MPSRRASWRRRISRISSACRSLSLKALTSAALGSSLSRMVLITRSMLRKAIIRPSRIWMRSSTLPSRNWLRRVTVATRNRAHSDSTSISDFCRGRPSWPIMTMLIDADDSMLVCASSAVMNSCGSIFAVFGSKTRRTAASLPDSSRTLSSTERISAFRFCCSGVSAFLPARTFGLVSSSISSITFWVDAPGGNSVTTTCHWPRASSSIFQRARTLSDPRPVSYAEAISWADEMICPPPGKSGPRMQSSNSAAVVFGLRISVTTALATSRRLWGGISVAMPTAMPDAPLSSNMGRRAGICRGSWNEPS